MSTTTAARLRMLLEQEIRNMIRPHFDALEDNEDHGPPGDESDDEFDYDTWEMERDRFLLE